MRIPRARIWIYSSEDVDSLSRCSKMLKMSLLLRNTSGKISASVVKPLSVFFLTMSSLSYINW
jgi:hypothetical protein